MTFPVASPFASILITVMPAALVLISRRCWSRFQTFGERKFAGDGQQLARSTRQIVAGRIIYSASFPHRFFSSSGEDTVSAARNALIAIYSRIVGHSETGLESSSRLIARRALCCSTCCVHHKETDILSGIGGVNDMSRMGTEGFTIQCSRGSFLYRSDDKG